MHLQVVSFTVEAKYAAHSQALLAFNVTSAVNGVACNTGTCRCSCFAGILEGIFSVGMLFLGWRTLSGVRKAMQKVATLPQKS